MPDFAGKVVLITGANGDLGTQVSKAFLESGATVAGAARTIDKSDIPHDRFHALPADVAAEDGAAALVQKVLDQFGRLDVLAHLVGAWSGGKLDATDVQTFDKMIAVNLRTSFLVIRAALKPMRTQGAGRILAIGSKAAIEPTPGSVAYAASKAALVSLIRSVAADVRDIGITANVVLPGTMDTAGNRAAMPKADASKFVDPVQVAALLVHLASNEAASINGAAIPILGRES